MQNNHNSHKAKIDVRKYVRMWFELWWKTEMSKIKVVATPAITPKAIRIQNNLANFLSFSLFSATLIGGSFDGSLELFVVGGEFSVSGISIFSSILGLESSFPGVGADFFFLNLAKVNF